MARTELAVATISGGDPYWHKRRSGFDAGAMVMQDFLPLMRSYATHAMTRLVHTSYE